MNLVLPQTKFEAILSRDSGRDEFLAEADASHQILGLVAINFFPIAFMAMT